MSRERARADIERLRDDGELERVAASADVAGRQLANAEATSHWRPKESRTTRPGRSTELRRGPEGFGRPCLLSRACARHCAAATSQ